MPFGPVLGSLLALALVIVTLGVLYVIVWGYLQLTGRIEEPFIEGAKRLLTLGVVLGLSLQLWLYNDVFVDTFFNAPTELAASIIAARNPGGPAFQPVAVVDEIFFDGDDAATLLMEKGEIFGRDIVFYFGALAIYLIVGLTAVYTMFLLAMSRIALAVLLAMGPIFLALLFFDSSKRFFEAWLAQLSNYAFLAVLTILVPTPMTARLGTAACATTFTFDVAGMRSPDRHAVMNVSAVAPAPVRLTTTAAESAVAAGGGIGIANALQVCAAAALTFLIMRQVPSMAQGMASGIALSGFGAVGNVLRMGMGVGRSGLGKMGEFSRGAFLDQDKSRWDSMTRKAGQRLIGARMAREKRPRQNTLKYG